MIMKYKKKIVIIIPARFNSSRFPGKPLEKILGKSMILRVWEKCIKVISKKFVYVATDDKRIADHCQLHGINYLMTRKDCKTGTDRVIEIAKKIQSDLYVNVQGDEPLININDIKKVIKLFFLYKKKKIINAMRRIKNKEEFFSFNVPKVVFDNNYNLIYMSRAAIPSNKQSQFVKAFKQVCIYAFSKKHLLSKNIFNNKSNLEMIEDIEILRFIENSFSVKMVEVSGNSISVDTRKDLKKVINILK
jgi:3-deoxy-manno-octulosonate cytidylyltransferase (CMP-KDO synthetase)